MKLWLYALGMCQSMFCAIPFPWHGWEEKARDRMLLCLPLIGLEIGLVWWGVGTLAEALGLPNALGAFCLCAAPYLLTGGLHLDGFMDVTDAVRSCRSLEKRREILKDSHVGSFAVVGVVLLMLCQYSICTCIFSNGALYVLALIPVVSRCGSVLAIQLLPPMQTSQYAARKSNWALPVAALAIALGFAFFREWRWGAALLAELAGFALTLRRAYKSLKGMNGDISGYCICAGELAGLLAVSLLYR